MSRSSQLILILPLIACLMSLVPDARATVIHSDVTADTVVYTSISEGSPTGDPEPLYGQPGAVGDTLVFPNITSSFAASSLDGGASDITDGKLNFMIEAKAGYVIDSFDLTENGLVSLNAPFGADAFAQVLGFAVIKVVEINNSPVNLPPFDVFMSTAPLGGQYQLSAIGGTDFSTGWTGTLSVPLPTGTTKASVVLNNNLFAATSSTATSAFIDKKGFEVDADTTLIPEPSTAMLGMTALVGMSLLRRKTFA